MVGGLDLPLKTLKDVRGRLAFQRWQNLPRRAAWRSNSKRARSTRSRLSAGVRLSFPAQQNEAQGWAALRDFQVLDMPTKKPVRRHHRTHLQHLRCAHGVDFIDRS